MNNINISSNCGQSHLENKKIDLDILKGMKIMAVDDHQNLLFLISEFFAWYEIKIITVSNALAALEIIEQSQLDLLISDITMPGKDGYWLIEKVRTLTCPQKRKLPAIAFTSIYDHQARQKIKAAGFQSYIQKSSGGNQLIIEAAKLLRNSQTRISTNLANTSAYSQSQA